MLIRQKFKREVTCEKPETFLVQFVYDDVDSSSILCQFYKHWIYKKCSGRDVKVD